MASEVDIVNLALSHLGDGANVSSISPSDGSTQADHAERFYAHIRDALLERFAWKFALRRATLAERADIAIPSWDHVYDEPNDCLRLLAILPGSYTADNQGAAFDTETDEDGAKIILTSAADATARFIARVEDTSKFSPSFIETLSWLLAAALAGPIIKGETGRQEAIRCLQAGTMAFAGATGLSANQSRTSLDFVPSIIAARGVTTVDDEGSFPIRGS